MDRQARAAARPEALILTLPAELSVRIRFARLADIAAEDAVAIFRARKRMFVDLLGWPLPSGSAALEVDTYDRDETVYALVGDQVAIRYSARILPRERSMVADLWPGALAAVPDGAVEFSRFCVHGESDPRWNRASTALFKAHLREQGLRELFGIADRRMVRANRAVLGIPADSAESVSGTADLFLCRWSF